MRLFIDRKNPNQQQVKIKVNPVTRGGGVGYARHTIPNQLSNPRNPYTGKEETNMHPSFYTTPKTPYIHTYISEHDLHQDYNQENCLITRKTEYFIVTYYIKYIFIQSV